MRRGWVSPLNTMLWNIIITINNTIMKRHHTSKLEDAVYHYEIIKITMKTLRKLRDLNL